MPRNNSLTELLVKWNDGKDSVFNYSIFILQILFLLTARLPFSHRIPRPNHLRNEWKSKAHGLRSSGGWHIVLLLHCFHFRIYVEWLSSNKVRERESIRCGRCHHNHWLHIITSLSFGLSRSRMAGIRCYFLFSALTIQVGFARATRISIAIHYIGISWHY